MPGKGLHAEGGFWWLTGRPAGDAGCARSAAACQVGTASLGRGVVRCACCGLLFAGHGAAALEVAAGWHMLARCMFTCCVIVHDRHARSW